MRAIDKLHPSVAAVYFVLVLTVLMVSQVPVIILTAFACGILMLLVQNCGRVKPKEILYSVFAVFVITVANMLISHRGSTVLFYLNGNAVTAEAGICGMSTGIAIVTVLMWCRVLNRVMTEDKIMYILGRPFPKIALVLSMTLRFVPLLRRKTEETRLAAKASGAYSAEGGLMRMKAGANVISSVAGWAMENAIDRSVYMQIRGFGAGKRTSYSEIRFRISDFVFLIVSVLASAAPLYEIFSGKLKFQFYPSVTLNGDTVSVVAALAGTAVLCLLPVFVCIGDDIRWKFCARKI